MTKDRLFFFLSACSLLVMAGCSTRYDTASQSARSDHPDDNTAHLFFIDERPLLALSKRAIIDVFSDEPDPVSHGYRWHHQPLMDWTNFHLMLTPNKVEGRDGVYFSLVVTTNGSQGLVVSRYIEPFLKRLETMCAANNYQIIHEDPRKVHEIDWRTLESNHVEQFDGVKNSAKEL